MRVLFDTNVVLDVLLDRTPHAGTATRLLSYVDTGVIDGVLCATTLTTIHYLVGRARDAKTATGQIGELLSMFDVAAVDRGVLESAVTLGFTDFEDAVLHQAARAAGAAAIVTRNGADFTAAALPVFDPPELLAAVLATR